MMTNEQLDMMKRLRRGASTWENSEATVAMIDAAIATLEALPVTADGVRVVPGMMLWEKPWDELEDRDDGAAPELYHHPARRHRPIHPFLVLMGYDEHNVSGHLDVRTCYYTREAAEAGK